MSRSPVGPGPGSALLPAKIDHALIDEIGRIAAVLLNAHSDDGALQQAVTDLYERLQFATGALDARETQLASGRALSGKDAVHCVLDFRRTAKFVRAVDDALARAAARWPGPRIRLLYAGCGPWAPLVLLLAARWQGRIGVSLVDVHHASLRTAHALFVQIGQSDLIVATHCADASTLMLDEDQRPHVLLAEVMQRALADEPQVAVASQLVPQLVADGIMVPERIVVRAVLAVVAGEFDPRRERTRIELGDLMLLSTHTARLFHAAIALGATHLSEICVELPDNLPDGVAVMLCTRIDVGPGHVLDDYDSGLTHPLILHRVGVILPGRRLRFRFRLGQHPGFEYEGADGQMQPSA